MVECSGMLRSDRLLLDTSFLNYVHLLRTCLCSIDKTSSKQQKYIDK